MTRPQRIRLVTFGDLDTPKPGWAEIVFGPDSGEVGVALEALCALCLAVRVELRGGSCVDVVMSEVIHDHLLVRGWDKAMGHTDELILLALSSVSRVTIWVTLAYQ